MRSSKPRIVPLEEKDWNDEMVLPSKSFTSPEGDTSAPKLLTTTANRADPRPVQ